MSDTVLGGINPRYKRIWNNKSLWIFSCWSRKLLLSNQFELLFSTRGVSLLQRMAILSFDTLAVQSCIWRTKNTPIKKHGLNLFPINLEKLPRILSQMNLFSAPTLKRCVSFRFFPEKKRPLEMPWLQGRSTTRCCVAAPCCRWHVGNKL